MDEMSFVLDRHHLGLDYHATIIAVENQSGVGQIPASYGEFGWFALHDIHTMLYECGCGRGEDCENPVVYYVLRSGDGFAFITDIEGKPVECGVQTMKYQAKLDAGVETIVEYINHVEAELLTESAQVDRLVKPLVDRIIGALEAGRVNEARHLADINSSDPRIYERISIAVASRFMLPRLWRGTQVKRRARKYINLIANQVSEAHVRKQMLIDSADREVVALVEAILANEEFGSFEDDFGSDSSFPFNHPGSGLVQ